MKLATDPRLPIFGGHGYDKALYQRLYDIFRETAVSVNSDKDAIAANADGIAANATAIADLLTNAPWYGKAIGEPFALRDDLAGVVVPPTDHAGFRFIKLTASDAYNSGVLTSESVSGSAPLVVATAVISLAGSPLNGKTVNLWNTERRSPRAGSAGALLNDALQDHSHVNPIAAGATGSVRVIGAWNDAYTQNNGQLYTSTVLGARVANETRIKSQGVTYYMRVK